MQSTAEKNIAILCNPLAGVGKSVVLANTISKKLTAKKYSHQLFTEHWPENFTGFTDIWISGGDGTLNYFTNKYCGVQLPIVIFNGGTGNDFCWLLYGDKPFDEIFEIALNGNTQAIDIGKCNERFFINDAGIGFEAAVAKILAGKKKIFGKASFFISIFKKIFFYQSQYYSIKTNGEAITGKKLLVDVNNGCRAGGSFHVAPESRADDGLFDVVISGALNPFLRLRYLPVIEKGKHLKLSFIQHFRTNKITVESNSLIQYHLDGEYYEAEKLEIEMHAGALMFRC